MFLKSPQNLILLLGALRASLVLASDIACNNSPSLCSKRYNNITYLGAHDSPFISDSQDDYTISGNQFYNTTIQLDAGVRMLTAQVQSSGSTTNSADLHVCHTSCELLDAGSLSDWLAEIKAWMDSNPNDVVTVLLVNGAGATAEELATQYETAGIKEYAYTPSSAQATTDWPTLQTLIDNKTRLMSFIASLDDNSAAPYLMDEYTYMFENSYENSSPYDYSCEPNEPSNFVNDSAAALESGYMSLMNHFLYADQAFGIQTPNETYLTTTNAYSGGVGNLGSAARECASQYGQNPTFLLVDFFNVGPAIDTADALNKISDPVGRVSVSTGLLDASSSTAAVATPRYPVLTAIGVALFGLLCL